MSSSTVPDATPPEAVPSPALTEPETGGRPSVAAEIGARRLPQILGLYVGGATSAVLFVAFLVDRYALSPYLVDLLLLAAVLAVPGVAVAAWALGAPGDQRWSRRQTAALAANGVLGLGALAVAFWGKPLGATTETVAVETEAGVVERTVAKAAFRRRVAVADFEGDEALGRAAGYALALDLGQDLFVTTGTAAVLRRPLREAGFQTTAGAPTALLRTAAERWRGDHLLTGRVERTAGGFRVSAELRAVDGPDRPERYTAEGPALLPLLDDVSARVRADLGLPEVHLDTADDRAVEDILTGSTEALVAWGAALHARDFADDEAAALAGFETAVASDSTFAYARAQAASSLLSFARQAEALREVEAAQRHRYRLPEPHRFALDVLAAQLDGRPQDALAIAREWAALYPDDVAALHGLAALLTQAEQPDEAIEVHRRLVEVDAGNPETRYDLAVALNAEERYDEAREAAVAYVDAVPDEPKGYALLAAVTQAQGDSDEALALIERAARLAPDDIRYRMYRATYLMRAGRWDEAEAAYREVGARGAEPQDRASAQGARAHLYDYRGRLDEAAQTLDAVWDVYETFLTPAQILASRVGEGYHYTKAGRTADFEAALAAAFAHPEIQASPIYRGSLASAAAYAYAMTDRSAEVLRHAAEADSLYRAYGFESSRPFVRAVAGIGYANRGDHARAIRFLTPYVEKNPRDTYRGMALAEAHLGAGDERAARATVEQLFRQFPALPEGHLLLARLDARRRPADARRHLDTALAAWAGADDAFAPAREARALRQRLGA